MERTLEQWRDYLLPELAARIPGNTLLRCYFDGDHPIPDPPIQSDRVKYRQLGEISITNFCGAIVNSPAAKLTPKGVRFSEAGDEDLDVWRQVWTDNRLNAQCRVAHEEALKVGRSFALVWPKEDGGVSVTVEDADQVIVAYAPGSAYQRIAALKWYRDNDLECVTVWTAERVMSWARVAGTNGRVSTEDWSVDGGMPGGENPLGAVPVVEFLSKPNAKGVPSPELSLSVRRSQDNINFKNFTINVAVDAGAVPQRVLIGIEVLTDANGLPINPLRSGPNRIHVLQSQDEQNPSSGRIDQWQAYDITGLLASVEAAIKDLGLLSQTSAIYLRGGGGNIGADLIRALDDGHMAKVVAHQIVLGESWEEVFRLALIALGRDVPADVEIDWVSPEFRSPAEMADAAVKLRSVGYSFAAIARYMGASPSEIVRLVNERDLEALDVRGVISPDEARSLANRAGAGLNGPPPAR